MGGAATVPTGRGTFYCSLAFFLVLYALVFTVPSWSEGMGFIGPPEKTTDSTDRLFLDARNLAAQGNWTAAATILAALRSADPADGDVLYLSALAALKAEDDAASALAYLKSALSVGFFSASTPNEAMILSASLLVRERRYEEALSLLSETTSSNGSLDPEYYRIRVLAFLSLNKRNDAMAELAVAASRFPTDPRFARLFFERAGSIPKSEAEKGLSELFLGRLLILASVDPELTLLAVPFMLDGSDRKSAVEAYRATGEYSARATLLGLEYGIIDDKTAIAEFFSGKNKVLYADLLTLRDLIGGAEGREALKKSLQGFSASIIADRDGDGYFDEMMAYKAGVLDEWRLDADQDGHPDCSIRFSEGLPIACVLRSRESNADIEYGSYPYINGIRFNGQAGADIVSSSVPFSTTERNDTMALYRFAPESYAFAPLMLTPLFTAATGFVFYLPKPSVVPSPTPRAANSVCLEMEYTEGEFFNVVNLDQGIPLRRERFKAGKVYSILDYELGRPLKEIVDVDGDGRFETENNYRSDGDVGPAYVAFSRIDADGDGIFEYSEESRFPFKKCWDLNSDGAMDVVQLSLRGGGYRRDYSSRLNGQFDEVVVTDAKGNIVSFTRGGRDVALVPDKNIALRWIGYKPFDLGSNVPVSEGVYTYMGRRYRLILVELDAFAELLP